MFELLRKLLESDADSILWVVAISLLAFIGGELANRIIGARSARFLGVSVAVIAVIAGGALILSERLNDFFAFNLGRAQYMLVGAKGDAIVIGIYPNDAFGPQHRNGLHAGLAPYTSLRVVDLEASYVEMKETRAKSLLQQLRTLLTHHNVVAVVGPPVTEFTRAVVKEVERSGQPVPIFITSATSRDAAGWSEARIPLFRINSGIDERVSEFVELARNAVARHIPLVFLVETSVNSDERTYGQIVFDHIAAQIPEWRDWNNAGLVTRRPFIRGQIAAEVQRWDPDAYFARRQLIMLLGVGSDYRALVEAYFQANQPTRQSLVGGWMNAYAAEGVYKKNIYQWNKMFEVTDVALDERQTTALHRFTQELGQLTPALRDQAFSFDAGIIIGETFDELASGNSKVLHIDRNFLRRFVDALRGKRWDGVTGSIRFSAEGQNIGSDQKQNRLMSYTQYGGQNVGWHSLDGSKAIIALFDMQTSVRGGQ